MEERFDATFSIWEFFREAVHDALTRRVGLPDSENIEIYLTDLLTRFLHNERIFSLRNAEGARLLSLEEMLAEGDVLQNANSFDREREVHRHIGDFLLFWSGVFPEMLARLEGFALDPDVVALRQGSQSYEIVSSFDHEPFAGEAPTFKRLSSEFQACQYSLRLMRASFEGFRRQGWHDGFSA